jgi:predicted nucleotidyltransferase
VVLFGSWARGNHTAASDVDLLIVYGGVEREDAFALVKTALTLPGLEPHVYSVGEAQANHARLERMLAGGVVLYSQEEPS